MHEAIERREAGLLTYGITPPKRSYAEDRRRAVARRQTERIGGLPVDGLVVYDIQDESDRTSQARPFPFIQTIDPVEYAYDDLRGVTVPKIVYRCVGPLTESALDQSLRRLEQERGLCVMVGAASSRQRTRTRLADAYAWRQRSFGRVPLGGVLIAERHQSRQGEDLRVMRKVDAGCSFFVTQAVYSVVASKNVLSDLHYRCLAQERPVPPILVTLSPCGSTKTMEFMRWLGISVPRWLENELLHAPDILDTSIDLCTDILADLVQFAAGKGIPLGCNVESVSLRKAEIEASVELVHRARSILRGGRTAR
ncbi:MAG: 5,10-methylenetetrahydrofolate reductase [Myxococcota bacterium]